MLLVKQILPAAVVAMMTAAAICGCGFVLGGERVRHAIAPLAAGIAFAVGHFFISGWVSFPPTDTTNWLPYFGVAVAIADATLWIIGSRAWSRPLIFALLFIVAMRLLLRPKFQYAWSLAEGWGWVTGLGIALVLLAIVLNLIIGRSAVSFELPGVLMIVSAGTFAALFLSGSMLLGQLAAVLGAAILGTLALSARNRGIGNGVVPIFTLLQGALLISGCFFAALPASCAALLALAPFPALIPIRLPSRFLVLGIRAGLVLLPVAGALALAYSSSPPLDY